MKSNIIGGGCPIIGRLKINNLGIHYFDEVR
jgi:hypothetical protein